MRVFKNDRKWKRVKDTYLFYVYDLALCVDSQGSLRKLLEGFVCVNGLV